MRSQLTIVAALGLALSLGSVLAAAQGAASPARKPSAVKPAKAQHPEIAPGEECGACHQELTPELYQDWYAGRHGLMGVKCQVCHGSAGADFAKHPAPGRCLGCHADKVESLQRPFMKGKECFSCHTPHTLSPHR